MNEKRLQERFLRYVACESESFHEQNFCLLIEKELQELGLRTDRQEIGHAIGSDGWNIHAVLPGGGTPVLFSAHLDTVKPGVNIRPIIEDGVIRSSGDTILGSDDKSGIAALLEALARIKEESAPHRPVEILFTLCEEVGLLGSKNADYGSLVCKEAVVLDFGPVGTIIHRSPAYMNLHCKITGRASHAGLAPDQGIHALKAAAEAISNIPCGFIGNDSVQNIANLSAPGRANIVPDTVTFDAEIRSYDEDTLQRLIADFKAQVASAASRFGAAFEISEERVSNVLYVPEDSALIRDLTAAMEACGIEPKVEKTFGGSDATWLSENGLSPVNIGVGMADVHGVNEHIAIADLTAASEILYHFICR